MYVKNSTDYAISFCYGKYSSGGSFTGFFTKGWYTIDPGEKKNLGLTFITGSNTFYYYAKSTNGNKWEGNSKLLVSSEAFQIKNADKQITKDKSTKYSWVLFTKKTLEFGLLETKTQTLNFTQSEETEAQNAGFNPFNTYKYYSDDFSADVELSSNGKNDYKMDYNASTPGGCFISFTADGYYDEKTKLLIFSSEDCKVTFQFTTEKNIKLLNSEGENCSIFHGAGCDFYLVTYKLVVK